MIKIIALIVITSLCFSQNTFFTRNPALSPNAEKIAYSYAGDLWLVARDGGNSTRLTAHEGYDFMPKWSPNGKRIAFISDRFGNDDVLSMKSDGTDIRRHTFHSSNDRIISWENDETILFTARRAEQYHWMPEVYSVSLNGNTPEKFLKVNATDGFMSAQNTLFYTNGYNHNWRKRYRGSANNDIFSYNGTSFEQHTNFKGNDLFPMVSENELFYITEEKSGIFNLVSKTMGTTSVKQLTAFDQEGIRFASISKNSDFITLSVGLETFLFNTTTNELKRIDIHTPEDLHGKELTLKTITSGASEMRLSPDEKQIALVYKGDIYVYKKDEKKAGRIQRLTTSMANDNEIIWSKDSKSIYFLSDKAGQVDVYNIKVKNVKMPFYLNRYFDTTQMTNSSEDESNLDISKDGKNLSFVRNRGDFYTYSISTKKEDLIVEGWNFSGYSWSPDGKFIAYSKSDNNFNNDIYIINLSDKKSVNISQHPDGDYSPVWSPDGKKLAFSSKRFGDSYDIMYVYLSEKDAFKTKDDWLIEEEIGAIDEPKKKSKKGKKKKSKTKETLVKIDFKNIHKRVKRLTHSTGNEFISLISDDGKSFYYTHSLNSEIDLFVKKEWEKKPKQLTHKNTRPSFIQFSSNQKNIFYKNTKGNTLSITSKGGTKKSYKYKAIYSGNSSEMRMQVVTDIWRFQKENFYDEFMHGADWDELKKTYITYVKAARNERDFTDQMNMLLGELNSSHQGYRPKRTSDEIYGNLGGQFKMVKSGAKIASFFKHSPLSLASTKINVGDVITKVDNQSFSNIYTPFLSRTNERVELTILRKNKLFTSLIRPVSSREIRNLSYKNWVDKNRSFIDKQSESKLGYIHIRGMNIPSLEQFEMELFSEAEGKDALIIDVRFNGGGWTTDFLLNILMTPEHAFTVPRGGGIGYPQGRRTFYNWSKPVIVLCNEFSYSNAEIFSHAIKTLNRGTIIGNQTFGAVISTGGKRLLNGASVRRPFRGWFVKGSNINQEKIGALPDHIVIPAQIEQIKGIDSQLNKALDVFKSGL